MAEIEDHPIFQECFTYATELEDTPADVSMIGVLHGLTIGLMLAKLNSDWATKACDILIDFGAIVLALDTSYNVPDSVGEEQNLRFQAWHQA